MLNEFNEVLGDRRYQSRSKGIRDALKDYILRYQWMKDIEGERVGILSVIYDHRTIGVMENLTENQHKFREYINSTMHIHMSDKNCLEVIVVHGDAAEIRNLTEKLMSIRGVEHVKLTTTNSGE